MNWNWGTSNQEYGSVPRSNYNPNQRSGDNIVSTYSGQRDNNYGSNYGSQYQQYDNYAQQDNNYSFNNQRSYHTNYQPESFHEGINNQNLEKNSYQGQYEALDGIPNIGNTCYMNSVLQSIFHIPGMRKQIQSSSKQNYRAPLLEHLRILFENLARKTNYFKSLLEITKQFKYELDDITPQFKGLEQHDAHEFFRFILERLLNETNSAVQSQKYSEFKPKHKEKPSQMAKEWQQYMQLKENSPIKNLFGGTLISRLQCRTCSFMSCSFEDTLDFSLALEEESDYKQQQYSQPTMHQYQRGNPYISNKYEKKGSNSTIQECLANFVKVEEIQDFYCERCKLKRNIRRQVMLWKCPKILVIHFKRFNINKYGQNSANKRVIEFPVVDLTLKSQKEIHSDSEESYAKYDLIGYIKHFGTLDQGHYISIIKDQTTNNWLEFNDDKVHKIDKSDLKYDSIDSQEPYILFYQRK